MDPNLKEIFSKTISGAVDYIDRIFKHLPKNFISETNDLKQSFQKLLEYLEDDKDEESKIYDNMDHLYEQVLGKDVDSKQGIKKHETSSSPEIKDTQYLSLQESLMFREDPTNTQDNSYTQVYVLVNNEVKGMYYCLIENGALLLNKSLERVQAEYDIPLEKYAFRLEDKIKIEFDYNQLVIKLIFSCENECEKWFEYFLKAKHSIYSYASLPRLPIDRQTKQFGNSTTALPNNKKLELVSQTSYPTFKRCWSVEDGLDQISNSPVYEYVVDLSLQNLVKTYENSIASHRYQNTSPKSSPTKNRTVQLFNRIMKPKKRSEAITKSPKSLFWS